MYLRIRHSTTYRYGGPVQFGPHRLMLRPRDSFDLRVVDTALSISPQARLRWMHDVYGNSVAVAHFEAPSDKLDIVKLNVDEHPALAAKYQITSIPAMKVFQKGEVVKTVIGAKPKPQLEKDLADFLV